MNYGPGRVKVSTVLAQRSTSSRAAWRGHPPPRSTPSKAASPGPLNWRSRRRRNSISDAMKTQAKKMRIASSRRRKSSEARPQTSRLASPAGEGRRGSCAKSSARRSRKASRCSIQGGDLMPRLHDHVGRRSLPPGINGYGSASSRPEKPDASAGRRSHWGPLKYGRRFPASDYLQRQSFARHGGRAQPWPAFHETYDVWTHRHPLGRVPRR